MNKELVTFYAFIYALGIVTFGIILLSFLYLIIKIIIRLMELVFIYLEIAANMLKEKKK